MLAVLMACVFLGAESSHRTLNPLYRQLRGEGVELVAGSRTVLPPPLMADGLTPQQAREVLEAVPERHVPVDEFVRKSIVAPLAFRFRDLPGGGDENPIRGLDVYFVAYGDLAGLEDEKRLAKAVEQDRRDAQVRILDAKDLERRKITVRDDQQVKERYIFSRAELLERVLLSTTLHTVASRTEDSIVAASEVDKRFVSDPEFPDVWRPLETDANNGRRLGAPHPYDGAIAYAKATRLKEPAGAIFIEYHEAFVEPKGWFGGANLLRSKLPILIQSEVRTLRRELEKYSK